MCAWAARYSAGGLSRRSRQRSPGNISTVSNFAWALFHFHRQVLHPTGYLKLAMDGGNVDSGDLSNRHKAPRVSLVIRSSLVCQLVKAGQAPSTAFAVREKTRIRILLERAAAKYTASSSAPHPDDGQS
jgi:hypothetical protein